MIEKSLRKIIHQLLSIFYILQKKKINPTYISKISSNCEKQIIHLMVSNKEKEG